MRIESPIYRFSPAANRTNRGQEALFADTMKETASKEEEKEGDKKGRLVTAREDGYIRQYLVRPDGSKVLLSETQQNDSFQTAKIDQLPVAINYLHSPQSGFSMNTKETIALLNLHAGAVMTLPVNQQQLNVPSKESDMS
ncbi:MULTISPECIES: hypothetical protein [unclassified Paenibacillus]|uniref:hypothetical protein n=1 Tax=unclassified Paenibacillus TaxID=185978 RepID=UPI0025A2D7B4|nr:hypothetical protein [Paenibacillus sp. S-12]